MNEKDCGGSKVERTLYKDQKAYTVTENIGSYFGQTIVEVTFYSRKNPIFDYTVEEVL